MQDFALTMQLDFARIYTSESMQAIWMKYEHNVEVNIDILEELFTALRPLIKTGKRNLIVDTTAGLFKVTPEAEKEMNADPDFASCRRQAIVVKSLSTRLLAYFYIQHTHPPVTTKVFNRLSKALEWIKKAKTP
jgi:hypothetical protein